MSNKKPLVLLILDGFGISSNLKGNAIAMADTPFIKKISREYQGGLLRASGNEVGLSIGEMGNSEVGHLNIGSGRVVYQDLIRINADIESGHFISKNIWNDIVSQALKFSSNIHIMGLVSSGGIHSSIEHIYPIIDALNNKGFNDKIILHFFSDGQDVPPNTAKTYYTKLFEDKRSKDRLKLGSIIGRFYALDKSENWERTKEAYDCLTGFKYQSCNSFEECISKYYAEGLDDEKIRPTLILDNKDYNFIKDNDVVIFFDFRPDRARQLTKAFTETDFKEFEAVKKPSNIMFVSMTNYGLGGNIKNIMDTQILENTISEIISKNGLKQLHIAETEKYAHVTYFFDGGKEDVLEGETRIIVPSIKAKSYSDYPGMSAKEITAKVIESLNKADNDFYVINLANADMVGHTGDLQAGIQAIEVLDSCVESIVTTTLAKGGNVVITADHGNAEEMINDATGVIDKEHSVFPVPLWVIGEKFKAKEGLPERDYGMVEGLLADVAPTILEILMIDKPKEMSGQSLLKYLTWCPLIKKR